MRGAILLTGLLLCTPLQAQLSAELQVGANDFFVGEEVELTLTVTGVQSLDPAPELRGDGLRFRFLSASPGNRSYTVIVNGRTETSRQTWVSLRYALSAERAGRLLIPAQSFEVDGQTLSTRPVSVEVRPPTPRSYAFVELASEPPKVYVGQSFAVVLDVFLRRLEPEAGLLDLDPVFPDQPLTLHIPWIEKLEGSASRDANAFLNGLLGDDGIFRINDYSVGSGLFSSAARFSLAREAAVRDGLPYFRYRLRRTLTAQQSGTLAVPPVAVSGNLAVEARGEPNALRASSLPLRLRSDTLFVAVQSPPLVGRPALFNGAVGELRMRTAVQPREAAVGDPLTLTVELEGPGIAMATPPRLDQPGMERFKLGEEPDAVRSEGQTKTYTYTLRASSPEVTALPALAYVIFDPDSESYRTVHSEPVPLEIRASEQLSLDLVEGRGSFDLGSEQGPGVSVFGASEDWLRDATPAWYSPRTLGPQAWLLLLAPPLLALAWRLFQRWRGRLSPAERRRREAWTAARAQLHEARALLASDGGAALARSEAALKGYAAALCDVPEAGQTGAELVALLRARGAPEELLTELERNLTAVEGLRFSGQSGEQRGLCERIAANLQALRGAVAVALVLVCALPARAASPEVLADRAREALRLAAALPGDSAAFALREARAALDGIAAAGLHNAALYGSIGTLSLRLSEPVPAILAFRRAERFAPGDRRLAANLALARSLAGTAAPEPGWLGELLFWRGWLDDSAKGWLAALLWTLGWLWLGVARKHRGWAAVPLLLGLLLFASGYWQQRPYLDGELGVVTRSEYLYRGDAESYGKRFENPVPAGTEGRILRRSPGWVELELPGEAGGWLPASAFEELFPKEDA